MNTSCGCPRVWSVHPQGIGYVGIKGSDMTLTMTTGMKGFCMRWRLVTGRTFFELNVTRILNDNKLPVYRIRCYICTRKFPFICCIPSFHVTHDNFTSNFTLPKASANTYTRKKKRELIILPLHNCKRKIQFLVIQMNRKVWQKKKPSSYKSLFIFISFTSCFDLCAIDSCLVGTNTYACILVHNTYTINDTPIRFPILLGALSVLILARHVFTTSVPSRGWNQKSKGALTRGIEPKNVTERDEVRSEPEIEQAHVSIIRLRYFLAIDLHENDFFSIGMYVCIYFPSL